MASKIEKLVEEFKNKARTSSIDEVREQLDEIGKKIEGDSDEARMERLELIEALARVASHFEDVYYAEIKLHEHPAASEKHITSLVYRAAFIRRFNVVSSDPDFSEERAKAMHDYSYCVDSYISWLENEAPEATHPYEFEDAEDLLLAN